MQNFIQSLHVPKQAQKFTPIITVIAGLIFDITHVMMMRPNKLLNLKETLETEILTQKLEEIGFKFAFKKPTSQVSF